ncbi:MAG: head-tail connector protein [Robiginitomaculum sp.]
MPPEILNPPAIEPVALAYAKSFLRVDHTHDDALISDMIISARMRVESMSGHALIIRRLLARFPANSKAQIHLPSQPVSTVQEIRAVNLGGASSVIPANRYRLNTRCQPPRIALNMQTHWHEFTPNLETIEVEYFAGYGEDMSDVPIPFKQAILLLLAQSYEHRDGANLPVPMMVDALLVPYRWVRL